MNNYLGVMQGRLLPKYQGRYQAHPVGYWQEEFPLAAELGLDCIEFILDFNESEQNPLLQSAGRQQIRELGKTTGVSVLSVCADYFMEVPLHAAQPERATISLATLQRLLEAAADLEIKDVVIPCVDQSSIRNEIARKNFQERITEVLPKAERLSVNLSLETDLNPLEFAELLSQLDSPCVTVNYDIGNSASLGYDAKEELSTYGSRISDIHIKDRVLGGGSVRLGTGHADVPGFFELLTDFEYKGPFIMQAYRDDEGRSIFQSQLEWVRPLIEAKL